MNDLLYQVTVLGTARGKGSMETTMGRNGRPKAYGAKKGAAWQTLVALRAQENAPEELLEGPLAVCVGVLVAKPLSAPKRRQVWPTKRGSTDVDKIARAVLDSLTGIVYRDDSQVTHLRISKNWAEDARPRVEIAVFDAREGWPPCPSSSER